MENIAYKSFSAFDGIIIHGIEYGAGFSFEDKTFFPIKSTAKQWDESTNARFTTTQAERLISVFVGGVSI